MRPRRVEALPVVLRELQRLEDPLEQNVVQLPHGLVARALLVLEGQGHHDRLARRRVGELVLGLVGGHRLRQEELHPVKDLFGEN